MSSFCLLFTQSVHAMDQKPPQRPPQETPNYKQLPLSSLPKNKQEEQKLKGEQSKLKPIRPHLSRSLSPHNEIPRNIFKKTSSSRLEVPTPPRERSTIETEDRKPRNEKRSSPKRSAFSMSPHKSKEDNEKEKSSRPIFSLHSRTHKKENTDEKRSPSSDSAILNTPRTSASPSVSPKKNNNYLNDDNYLVDAARKGKISIIKNFLDDPEINPNQQTIGTRNTLFHIAVIQRKKNEELIYLFLHNHRVDILIKNEYKCAPYQCFDGREIIKYQNLHNALKSRATLDQTVNALLMVNPEFIQQSYSDDNILKKIYQVKMRITDLPLYATATFILAMIRSRIQYKLPIIKMFFDNQAKNLSEQDEYGNTCFHHTASLRDKEMMQKLVETPISSLIKNANNLLAHQLIPSTEESSSELRHMLFARNSLDFLIQEHITSLLLTHPILSQLTVKNEWFQQTTKEIRDTYAKIENAQATEDRQLPKETSFPKYANDQFLLDVFLYRMQDKKPKELKVCFKTEEEERSDFIVQIKPRIAPQTTAGIKQQKNALAILDDIMAGKLDDSPEDTPLIGLDSSSSLHGQTGDKTPRS